MKRDVNCETVNILKKQTVVWLWPRKGEHVDGSKGKGNIDICEAKKVVGGRFIYELALRRNESSIPHLTDRKYTLLKRFVYLNP